MLPYLYFLKVIICSAIFMGYYYVALRNKIYHQYNRFYLLFAVFASWLFPLFHFNIEVEKPATYQPIYNAITYISQSNEPFEFEYVAPIKQSIFTIDNIAIFGYISIAVIIMAICIVAIFKVFKLTRKYNKGKIENCVVYYTNEPSTPFSFFSHIFWNNEIDVTTTIGKQILQHELTHIQQKHSWDKLLLQLNLIAGWFNPFFWLIKKELEMIHEFIADKKSVPNADTQIFAQMLLNTAFAGKQLSLTNPFFFSPIKRRLIMLTKNKHPKFSYLQRIVALPLMALIIVLFSFKAKGISIKQVLKNNFSASDITANKNVNESEAATDNTSSFSNFILQKKYKVVIDAGHGGKDLGASSKDGNIHEKDIALAIAKTIKEQNTNDNIEIILTRENDVFQDPKQKAEFVNNQNADLFVSVHCNYVDASPLNDSKSGIEIIVVSKEKDNGFKEQSDALAKHINSSLSTNFKSNNIHSRQVGIWVLQATKCPGILIETGFIDNATDLKMLKDENKQQLMAKNILSGIEQYLYKNENNTQLQLKDTTINNALPNTKLLNEKSIMPLSGNGVTNEEMQEYFNYQEQAKTKFKEYYRRYSSEALSEKIKDRMFELYSNMTINQQQSCFFHFSRPSKPFEKDIPTNEQINKWLNNKTYGIWIDEKHIANSELSKYKGADFSHHFVSKLYGAAIKTANGRTVQVNLMTNKYYEEYVAKSKKEKYIMWFKMNNMNKKALATTNGATESEIQEYKQFIEKTRTNSTDIAKKFDTKKLTTDEKEKMFMIFHKMDEQQKESVEIKAHKNSDTYIQQSPTQKQINEWLANEHYTIEIDNKTINKETIQNIKATDFAVYGILETFLNGSNPSENKYEVKLITNQFYYRNKGNQTHLYWNNFSPKTLSSKAIQQATVEEVKWMESFSIKYNPFALSTLTTKDGITQEERKKAEQIFDKMSTEQRQESNVVFENPRPEADLNKNKNWSKYISMKVNVRKRYY